jgi:hypothetical protein
MSFRGKEVSFRSCIDLAQGMAMREVQDETAVNVNFENDEDIYIAMGLISQLSIMTGRQERLIVAINMRFRKNSGRRSEGLCMTEPDGSVMQGSVQTVHFTITYLAELSGLSTACGMSGIAPSADERVSVERSYWERGRQRRKHRRVQAHVSRLRE